MPLVVCNLYLLEFVCICKRNSVRDFPATVVVNTLAPSDLAPQEQSPDEAVRVLRFAFLTGLFGVSMPSWSYLVRSPAVPESSSRVCLFELQVDALDLSRS